MKVFLALPSFISTLQSKSPESNFPVLINFKVPFPAMFNRCGSYLIIIIIIIIIIILILIIIVVIIIME